MKKEPISGGVRVTRSRVDTISEAAPQSTLRNSADEDTDNNIERRVLRSKYLRFKNRICGEIDDISKADPDKFKSIINEVDNLHQLVQKPREQVADAEALFDITNTLVSSVKSYRNEGVTPSFFVSCLIRDFGQLSEPNLDNRNNDLRWNDIGQVVSPIFLSAPACCTMVGPMNIELKQRKTTVHRKRTRPAEDVRPEELDNSVNEEKTDTDKNMATMFDILRRNRKSNLEKLILNRNSFAQTVENVFALSFLIKDGRAEIIVDGNGSHLVSPKNAPTANAILSGEAFYSHFIFRFDFKDWKLMLSSVTAGDELMPHRTEKNLGTHAESAASSEGVQEPPPTTPIRKLTRNRGLIMQEQSVVQDSPETGDKVTAGAATIRKGKRKLR